MPEEQPQQQQQPVREQPSNPDDVPWKKVWTINEMRDSAKDWNLSSDAGVSIYLLYLFFF